ncbi:MAG: GNAT family N-acetyltransferase [Janthinobacterium lividum]
MAPAYLPVPPDEKPSVELRALEPDDLDFLYALENDRTIWAVSDTLAPISRHALREYLQHATADFYEVRQLRLVVTSVDWGQAVGVVDLFDFDPRHQRAGVGITIRSGERRRGYAWHALQLVMAHARDVLHLHQLYCTIAQGNRASISLFRKAGFRRVGIRQEWLRDTTPSGWVNAIEMQFLLRK